MEQNCTKKVGADSETSFRDLFAAWLPPTVSRPQRGKTGDADRSFPSRLWLGVAIPRRLFLVSISLFRAKEYVLTFVASATLDEFKTNFKSVVAV